MGWLGTLRGQRNQSKTPAQVLLLRQGAARTRGGCAYLAFHCPSFAESEDLAREAFVLSFVGTKTKLTQEKESAKNTVLKRRAKRPREEGAEYVEVEKEGAASTHAVSKNVFLHGLAGAKLRLSTTGDAGFCSTSRGYRVLASRWPTTCSFAE